MPIFIINILLGISLLTIVILSTLLWLKSRAQSSIFLALSAYSAAIWIIATLFYINTSSALIFTWANKLLHIAGLLILTSFSFFAYTFLASGIKNNKKLLLSLLFFSAVFIFLIIFSENIIENTEWISGTKEIPYGLFYPCYAFYIVMTAFLSYYFLVKKSLKSESKIEKMQLIYIGAGTIISLSVGLVLNIILCYFGHFKYYWLGPFLSVIFVISTFYAILKHHLFNIKLISVELFSSLMLILMLIDVLMTKTGTELFLKLILFVGVGIISILIIRSILNEIRAKEKIEKLAAQLSDANRELQRLDREKSDFLSIASHQLRTPLTVIKGYVSMFNEGMFGELGIKAKDAMSKIYVSSERLIKLIADLLDLSRIERGKMKYIFEKQDIEKVISETIAEFVPVAKEKSLYLDYKKPESSIPQIPFDADYIRQVLLNLLDNAIKYTAKGGVRVILSASNSKIKIEVKDTGEGITKEEKNKLFKRYRRGLEEGSKGLGMGLYLAKKIIDDHKGKIWAESEGKNMGSSFFVELPAP